MARYISLISFTERGAQNVKDSPHRADAFKEAAKGKDVEIKDIYWTLGGYDGVIIFEADNDESAAALGVVAASAGNVKTHTLRAFDRSEIEGVLQKADGIDYRP